MQSFHLAIPVIDINETKSFYSKLGLNFGREDKDFVVINFYQHQVVAHLSPHDCPEKPKMYPRHFGLVLDKVEDIEKIYTKAKENQLEFFQDEFIRFLGKEEEHKTFFLKDPSNNLIEFKWYKDQQKIFG